MHGASPPHGYSGATQMLRFSWLGCAGHHALGHGAFFLCMFGTCYCCMLYVPCCPTPFGCIAFWYQIPFGTQNSEVRHPVQHLNAPEKRQRGSSQDNPWADQALSAIRLWVKLICEPALGRLHRGIFMGTGKRMALHVRFPREMVGSDKPRGHAALHTSAETSRQWLAGP